MTEFVAMPDGALVNAANIVRVRSKAEAYRIDYVDGSHYTQTEEAALFLRDALLEAGFVEMPDGMLVNAAKIVRVALDDDGMDKAWHAEGSRYDLSEADALFLRDALLGGSEAPVGPALTKDAPKKTRKKGP